MTGTWHCVVGRNFGCSITHDTKFVMFLQVELLHVLIFKSLEWARKWKWNKLCYRFCSTHVQRILNILKRNACVDATSHYFNCLSIVRKLNFSGVNNLITDHGWVEEIDIKWRQRSPEIPMKPMSFLIHENMIEVIEERKKSTARIELEYRLSSLSWYCRQSDRTVPSLAALASSKCPSLPLKALQPLLEAPVR